MAMLNVGTENSTSIHLYYEDHGTGRPVVLIHGWPLSGRSWEKQVSALIIAGYRVIAYDRRGFGWSSQPWFGYDYDTLAADLHALIEHLDLRDAILVGFSMGGGEVARYIGSYGTGRVSKAVLAAAVTPYLYRCPENPEGGLDDASITELQVGVAGDRIAFFDDFSTRFFAAGNVTDLISEPARLYHVNMAAFASPKGTLDCIGAFGRTDFRGDLKKMRLPTLVIHGDSDSTVPFEVSGKRSHELIQGSSLALIRGAPHGLIVTHAGQFNKALIDFLES